MGIFESYLLLQNLEDGMNEKFMLIEIITECAKKF